MSQKGLDCQMKRSRGVGSNFSRGWRGGGWGGEVRLKCYFQKGSFCTDLFPNKLYIGNVYKFTLKQKKGGGGGGGDPLLPTPLRMDIDYENSHDGGEAISCL